jgi:hypothetical protein
VNRDALLQVLRETRRLLARANNNFNWSSWDNADAALAELDALIECVGTNAQLDRQQLAVLFASTGPIQEVSLSSGWAEAFLELAARVDDAMR